MVGKDRADRRRDTGHRPRVKDQVKGRDQAQSKDRDQASGRDRVRDRDQVGGQGRAVEDSTGYDLRLTTTS